jgi:hypothetical protein
MEGLNPELLEVLIKKMTVRLSRAKTPFISGLLQSG